MIEDEIRQLAKFLPQRVVQVIGGVFLVLRCVDMVVSIKSEYLADVNNARYDTRISDPPDDLYDQLRGLDIEVVELISGEKYPGLEIKLSGNGCIKVFPGDFGEELWYIDVTGSLFITP